MRTVPKKNLPYLYLNGVLDRDLRLALVSASVVLRQKQVTDGTRTEFFLPAVAKFLGKSKISGILVAQGGGSYSQTRLVCAVANALAYAWGIKVAGVSSEARVETFPALLGKLKFKKLLLPSYYGPAVGK